MRSSSCLWLYRYAQWKLSQCETTLPTDPDHAKKYHLAEADPKWHGDAGPITKSYALNFAWGPLNDRVIDAMKELGATYYPDTVCTSQSHDAC